MLSYIPSRKKRKDDSLICSSNDYPADDYNDQQQHLLQTILISEELEISSIDPDKSETTTEIVIQTNLADSHCIK